MSLAGRGGMGEVYRADDLKLGHPVALNFLPRGVAESSRRFQLFVSEVRASRQLAHPNVCRVYDIDEVDYQWISAAATNWAARALAAAACFGRNEEFAWPTGNEWPEYRRCHRERWSSLT